MRIQSSMVQMLGVVNHSDREERDHLQISFSDFMKVGQRDRLIHITADTQGRETTSLSIRFIEKRSQIRIIIISNNSPTEGDPVLINEKDKRKMIALQELIERLTGKKVKFYAKRDFEDEIEDLQWISLRRGAGNIVFQTDTGSKPETGNSENESVTFVSKGIIKTSDGRSIDFNVNLRLSKEFMRENHITAQNTAFIDPLVINYEGDSTELTGEEFSFDIDLDGGTENIAFVGKGSGFLAIDLNNDGVVNDGSELFGPKSGNGFGDLAVYDSDKNNWIDENDPVFEKLRIWTKDSEGKDILFALGVKGIGALYLGNVSTEYAIGDTPDSLDAYMRQTGIFIRENGTVGTIQDLEYVI
ncbi:MAG: hypothetical protein N2484_12185 [Clostridia bacterium]|nr:hypothetical protein [Clostridia bacterium]